MKRLLLAFYNWLWWRGFLREVIVYYKGGGKIDRIYAIGFSLTRKRRCDDV